MKISNILMNKKKIASMALAFNISLCPLKVSSEIVSYINTITVDDKKIFLHYIDTINNAALVEIDNKLVYVPTECIDYSYLDTNNYYQCVNGYMETNNNCYMYLNFDSGCIIEKIDKGCKVRLLAKNNDGWYVVSYNNKIGFVNEMYLMSPLSKIEILKITGNNVNIRNMPSISSSIIGFADITDYFEIIEEENNWYKIKYLDKIGYVNKKYAKKMSVDEDNIKFKKIVYLTKESAFYQNLNGNIYTFLPQYQNAFVIDEVNNYYKVMIDGIIGYIYKYDTKKLSNTCVIIDLPRQILKVYQNSNEIMRFHIITGSYEMQTTIGCFSIGHCKRNYQLTPTNFVRYWIQYNGNEGIHDASWQQDMNFSFNADMAYKNFGLGNGLTYPIKYGSHGCDNMKESDAEQVFNVVNVEDNVLVVGPNNLVNLGLTSKKGNILKSNNLVKIKKLV